MKKIIKNKKNITQYSNQELLLIVMNTEKYYDLYHSHNFNKSNYDYLYQKLEIDFIYKTSQLQVLKDYINNNK